MTSMPVQSSATGPSGGSMFEPLLSPELTRPLAPKRSSLRSRVNGWWSTLIERRVREPWRDPSKKPRMVRAAWIAGALLLAGGATGAYFALRATPQPDYLDSGLDDVLDYTLLTDEFNKLPVAERLKLVGQLIARLKSMDAGDSAMMAAFAAGIAGAAREQLMENVSLLAVDVWDTYATRYDAVPAEDREKFLDDAFLEFTKTMEGVGGVQRNVTDEERIAEAKRNAERDSQRMKEGKGPSGEQLGRMFTFLKDGVGSHATPHQRARGAVLMRDMVRHFRGESPAAPPGKR
jgi:hypothetical protein